jgi:signal transduction histidine kinase
MRAGLLSPLLLPSAPPLTLGLVVATVLIAAESFLVVLLKEVAPGNAFGVVYLFGVLAVSTIWGLGVSAITSVASALAFDYFRDWPAEWAPIKAQNGVVIVIFLVVALSASSRADLARSWAAEADQRRRQADMAAERARLLAEQQAAVRRVAMVMARGVPLPDLYSAVLEELACRLGVDHAALLRYKPDGGSSVVASRDLPGSETMPVGDWSPLAVERVVAMVFRTGRGTGMDNHHDHGSALLPARVPAPGLRSCVGAPIVLNEQLWGAVIVDTSRPEPLPADTQTRVADFADLVATAIANAETRAELAASRARLIMAGDDARRRFERDLHDGAQQRLVSLGLELRTAETSVPHELLPLQQQISHIVDGLAGVSADLQEISRGIYPTILSKGGLGPTLNTLARRSVVPVQLDVTVERRLPECVAVAAYYVVAEALANAAKHARASQVSVRVETDGSRLRLSIRDDGIGAADLSRGSGLIGLIDRVEAVGGHLEICSPTGQGTSLIAEIPLHME